MNQAPIIGLYSSLPREGKDTVAGILESLYGYQPVSFSDILNKALVALNPLVEVEKGQFKFRWRYADLIADVGYEAAKEYPEVRRLLRAMGTEVGRDILGQDVWVEALFKNLPTSKLVAITNVRFPNEYDAVLAHGGLVWRVQRPGIVPDGEGHRSDGALDDYPFDNVIVNDGTLRELADRVMRAMESPLQGAFARHGR